LPENWYNRSSNYLTGISVRMW